MFLVIIVLLVWGNMYFEFKIAKALHLDSWSKKFVLLNLAISILISIGTAMLFPAAGMTIAAAGILSTVLSSPMYLTLVIVTHSPAAMLSTTRFRPGRY